MTRKIEGNVHPDPDSALQLNDKSRLIPIRGKQREIQAYQRITSDGKQTMLTLVEIASSNDFQRFANSGNLWLILDVNTPQQQTREIARVNLETTFKQYNKPISDPPSFRDK